MLILFITLLSTKFQYAEITHYPEENCIVWQKEVGKVSIAVRGEGNKPIIKRTDIVNNKIFGYANSEFVYMSNDFRGDKKIDDVFICNAIGRSVAAQRINNKWVVIHMENRLLDPRKYLDIVDDAEASHYICTIFNIQHPRNRPLVHFENFAKLTAKQVVSSMDGATLYKYADKTSPRPIINTDGLYDRTIQFKLRDIDGRPAEYLSQITSKESNYSGTTSRIFAYHNLESKYYMTETKCSHHIGAHLLWSRETQANYEYKTWSKEIIDNLLSEVLPKASSDITIPWFIILCVIGVLFLVMSILLQYRKSQATL